MFGALEHETEARMHSEPNSAVPLLQITPRERRALQLLADGDTPTEVALRLGVSSFERDALLTKLFAAMGVTSRADAVAGARRRGLIVPPAHPGLRDGPDLVRKDDRDIRRLLDCFALVKSTP